MITQKKISWQQTIPLVLTGSLFHALRTLYLWLSMKYLQQRSPGHCCGGETGAARQSQHCCYQGTEEQAKQDGTRPARRCLKEQRWAVTAVLSDGTVTKLQDARVLELKDEYWQLMEDMVPVLGALKCATTIMSAEREVSTSNT